MTRRIATVLALLILIAAPLAARTAPLVPSLGRICLALFALAVLGLGAGVLGRPR
jgi:hypothetical protein